MTHVDATGTRRRLQALAAAGQSWRQLATHAHMDDAQLHAMANARGTVADTTATRIRDLYDKLSDQPIRQPDLRVARHRWPLPIQWIGVDIDDPAAEPNELDDEPDHVLVERILAGRASPDRITHPADREELIRRLDAAGHKPWSKAWQDVFGHPGHKQRVSA